MSFPCTSCGACCALVTGPPRAVLGGMGWVLPSGACKNYDPATRRCVVYDTRPDICRVDAVKPQGMSTEDWYEKVEGYCDWSHRAVYGTERVRATMELQIETTSTCNAKCHFCVYPTAGRQGGLMTMSLYKKLIDEAASIPHFNRVVLHGLGEPLLDPLLPDRVWYARQTMPKADIEIFTNGVYLDSGRFDELVKAGITSVVVSLNAVNQEQHEGVMGLQGKFDMVCRNIDYAIANRGDVSVQVHAVCNDDKFTMADIPTFYERWGHIFKDGHGQCVTEGNWANNNRTVHWNWHGNETCYRAMTQIYVMYDGRVSMCCFDPTGITVFGDLNESTIREVYNSEAYLNFRVAHSEERADEYEQCKNCTRI